MSIYSIANYAAGTTYNLHDIVRYPSDTSNFYYSSTDNHSGNTPSPNSSQWGGISSWNGILKPKFIWRTNYGVVAQHEPKTLDVVMGDGYSQRILTQINNDLLKLQVMFDLRTERETQAIVHFLFARQAKDSFLFTPSPPHDLEKLFICKQWENRYTYYNNHQITALFEETVN